MDAALQPRFAFLRERWFVLCLIAFFAALSIQYSYKVRDTTERDNRSAFLRWRAQILELDDGVNIWQRHNYPNPPIMVVVLLPLVALPPLVGSLAWFYLKAVMAIVAIHLAFRVVETPGRPWPIWAKALAVALTLRPIMGDLSHGNVNLFILLLCIFAFFCFRQQRDKTAGITLALAIACKLTPAMLIPYFVWKRSWKLLAASGAGLILFLWLLPGLWFGFEQNQMYLASWCKAMIEPYAVNGKVTTDHENQSLPGLIHRMVTDCSSFSTYVDDQQVTVESHNFVSWDPAVARTIVKLCMLVFGLFVLWVCRNKTDDRERWQLAAEYSLILVGMLLFSERTWKHHCVTMLLPFCVLTYYLAVANPTRLMKRMVIAVLIAAFLLMATTSTGWSKSLERFGKLAQVYGAYVWANLILAAALIAILHQQLVTSRRNEKFRGLRRREKNTDTSAQHRDLSPHDCELACSE